MEKERKISESRRYEEIYEDWGFGMEGRYE